MNPEVLPQKIRNLFLLQDYGIKVPPFFIIDEDAAGDFDSVVREALGFFKNNNTVSIIVRSASSCEDSARRSYAGFFESSGEILLKDLNADMLFEHWRSNKERAQKISGGCRVNLFIQEYVVSDLSGVLFTQDVYDPDEAVLMLSSAPQGITGGGCAERISRYDKQSGQWMPDDFLSAGLKNGLRKIISCLDKEYPEGSDVELGIRGRDIWVYQARPIVRGADEKILLSEKKRLKNIFKSDFKFHVWAKTPFIQSAGDLSPASIGLYNRLFCSDELRDLLIEARLMERNKKRPDSCRIFENIGNRTYCNICEERKVLPYYVPGWRMFVRFVRVFVFERLMAERSDEKGSKSSASLETAFAWLFLSAFYAEFFLEQQKAKMRTEDFADFLRDIETACGATEPRPKSLDDPGLSRFKNEYYFLADYPYDLASVRVSELSLDEIRRRYAYLKDGARGSRALPACFKKKIGFWLTEKIRWKEVFLKMLFEYRRDVIQKNGLNVFMAPADISEKMSFSAPRISASNFPFSESCPGREIILSAGDIDLTGTVLLKKEDNIAEYLHRYIAVSVFPGSWIPFIPQIKGLVLEAGNELSHVAITCREFHIPCRVIPLFFKR